MSEYEPSSLESRVLLLGPTARDAAMTTRVLASIKVACHACPTVSAVCLELFRGAGALILTEEMLEYNELRQLVDQLRHQPPWSDLPLLLLAGGGAGSQAGLRAMEIFRNVTVLERPVRTASLLSVVRTLLRSRSWQYQVRGYMLELKQAAVEREQLLKSELAARSEAERPVRS